MPLHAPAARPGRKQRRASRGPSALRAGPPADRLGHSWASHPPSSIHFCLCSACTELTDGSAACCTDLFQAPAGPRPLIPDPRGQRRRGPTRPTPAGPPARLLACADALDTITCKDISPASVSVRGPSRLIWARARCRLGGERRGTDMTARPRASPPPASLTHLPPMAASHAPGPVSLLVSRREARIMSTPS